MIDRKELERIALLSKIDISQEDEKFIDNIRTTIEMMGKISEIKLTMDDCPLDMDLTNTFREDVVKPSMSRQEVLANAPEVEAGCISVPKTLGKEE